MNKIPSTWFFKFTSVSEYESRSFTISTWPPLQARASGDILICAINGNMMTTHQTNQAANSFLKTVPSLARLYLSQNTKFWNDEKSGAPLNVASSD